MRVCRVFHTYAARFRCHDGRMTRSVLVVDDDPAFRELACRLVKAAGLRVAGQAESATSALAAASELRPDGALVDVDLPDRDGISLAQDLTSLPWRPRVVLTSVDADAARPEDVRRSGAHAFVHKAELPDGLALLLGSD
jgi:DNA-binding NarL/FixJ family response regulator